jgi:DtxR family Mn-dependent transcriptional regulator
MRVATSTVEDYLKCIYLEQERSSGQHVSTGQIASVLKVAPGTATSMVKTLAESGLVDYEPYSGVRLTPEGVRLAAHVLRRHRLVELFLVRVMGMNWSEVHGEAEVLEHAISDRLLQRMDEMLGSPSVDPHGDPIPSSCGDVERHDHPNLLGCELNASMRVARVVDQRGEFLRLLEQNGLMPGCRLTVVSRDDLSGTVNIRPETGRAFQLGYPAAATVLVELVD